MVVNDNAGHLTPRGVLSAIASLLAPTGDAHNNKPRHSMSAGAFCCVQDY
jgi:hypothetical protein